MDSAKLLFFLLCVLKFCQCANILFIVPFTSRSHYIMLSPVGLELARRGHNVTVITAFKEDDPPPNYHQVFVEDKQIWDILGGERPNVFTFVGVSAEKFHNGVLWAGGLGFTEVIFQSPAVKQLLMADHSFDLVIAEQFFQEATYILAHKYQTPLVLITTFGNCMRHNVVSRNPLQIATLVSEFLDIREPTSFSGRLRNFYFTVYEYFWWRLWYLPKQESLVKKYVPGLPEPVPSLYEMQRNASLFMVNSHFSVDVSAAYYPNIIEIGGLHLSKSNGTLPKDLKKILDEAKDGVIYINFGSNVRSSELPNEKKNAFLNVFRRFKQVVLWKWEDDKLGNKPDNLVIRKWLPQKEILSHPNVKVFISHGGLISAQEAIFNGVPMIGIPIYADQYNNLLLIKEMGAGRILEYDDINETTLESTLKIMLDDSSYRKKSKEISKRFKDRPMSALDTAMFWIEYVIRNNGAEYMKNSGLHLSWIENNMLDVYAIILIAALVVSFVFYCLVLRQVIKYVFFSSKDPHKKEQ